MSAATRMTATTTWTPRETWRPLPAALAGYQVRYDAQPYRMSAQQVAAWRGVWQMLLDKASASARIAVHSATHNTAEMGA